MTTMSALRGTSAIDPTSLKSGGERRRSSPTPPHHLDQHVSCSLSPGARSSGGSGAAPPNAHSTGLSVIQEFVRSIHRSRLIGTSRLSVCREWTGFATFTTLPYSFEPRSRLFGSHLA